MESTLVGFTIAILLQQLSLSQDLGCAVLSLHVVVQESMCHVTLDHGGVHEGTCPKTVASPYVLQRSRSQHSLFTVQNSRHLPQIHAWLGKFLHSSISFLLKHQPCWQSHDYKLHNCIASVKFNYSSPKKYGEYSQLSGLSNVC